MDNGSGGLGSIILFLPLIALVGFMFFGQRKRQREVAALHAALEVGDQVVTTSGLFGTIAVLDATTVTLDVAPGVQLRFDRRAVGMKAPVADVPTVQSGE